MGTRLIERLLEENSELHPKSVTSAGVVRVTAKTAMRPDKIFGANAQMKWSMVLNGIDSPYMMAKGKAFFVPNTESLGSELAELKEFEL